MNVETSRVLFPLLVLAAGARAQSEPPRSEQGEGIERAPSRIGIHERTLAPLSSPAALAEAANGDLLVAEADADRISVWNAAGERVREIAAGELLDPRGLAVLGERVFVADSGTHRVIELALDGVGVRTIGGHGVEPGLFRDPRGIAVTADALYVCDTGNDRVQKLALDGTPLASAGGRGFGDGRMLRPGDVAVAPDGSVYVTDSGNHRVHKLDADLRSVSTWGDFGPHPGFFASPEGVEVAGGVVYVVDSDNHRVQAFDPAGARLWEWGLHALLPREGEGRLHYPGSIAILGGDEPRAAIAEPYEDRVQVFRPTRGDETLIENQPGERVVSAHFGPRISAGGDLVALSEPGAPSLLLYDVDFELAEHQRWEPIQITKLAMWGRRIGELLAPGDVEIDWARKLVHVADPDLGRISSFRFAHDEERELAFDFFLLELVRSIDLAKLHELGASPAPLPIRPSALELHPSGELWVLDSLQRVVLVLSPEYEPVRLEGAYRVWRRPIDLAFTPDGALAYVVDELGPAIHGILARPADAADARPLAEFRMDGLRRPAGIAVAPDGSVFVSDRATSRIHRFEPSGELAETFGGPGIGPLEFHKPAGLDVDARSRLWIVDWGNHRGQARSAEGEFLGAFGSRWFVRPAIRGR
jgi:tripartite motif-containing protein 71